jgi:hypothetical protein
MVKTHRQGAAMPFAKAFENHVQQLSSMAMATDNEKIRDQKRNQVKKIATDA